MARSRRGLVENGREEAEVERRAEDRRVLSPRTVLIPTLETCADILVQLLSRERMKSSKS